jgi:glycosyltransferase involved in cell wall biosynthesis
MLLPPAEGYHVASRKIIEAVTNAGINNQVITIESNAKSAKNNENWTAVGSKLSTRLLPAVFSGIDDMLTSVDIASRVRTSDCNLVHVLNVTKEAYAIVHNLLRVKKPLLVHFYHSPEVLSDDIFLMRNIAFKAGLHGRLLNSHVLTVNFLMYNFFIEKLGVDPEHVHYAPYPINTSAFKPFNEKEKLRIKHHLPLHRFIVAYVGSLQPARGVPDLVRAFRLVADNFPEVLLLICHPQRKEERSFENLIREQIRTSELNEKVIVRGLTSRIDEVYNAADVIVLPLTRPYWVDPPLVLLEAMSCGSTVITTPVGAISEVAQDNRNALLVEPGNPHVLAQAIVKLLENPHESRRLARKARETIIQKYAYEAVAKNLLKIYNCVLSHPN